jgi:hypothetical protein
MLTVLLLTAADDPPSGWRAVLFVTTLFVVGFVLVMVRRRLAPRTISHWGGTGIRTDLTPAQAAVLLRIHPGIILGLALDVRLRCGDATIRSVRPFRINWPDPEPDGPVEEALAAALGPEGEIDFDGACAALEAQYEEADEALRSVSGRLSALHYRQTIKDLLEQVARTGSLAETDPTLFTPSPATRRASTPPRAVLAHCAPHRTHEYGSGAQASVRPDLTHSRGSRDGQGTNKVGDLSWLLLADANALYDAGAFGPGGAIIRDVSRFAGALRGHLLPDGELLRAAAGAKSGFFAYRKDLRAGRAHRDTGHRPKAYALPGPPDDMLEALRGALDGNIVDGCPVWDPRGLTFGMTVTGWHDGHPVAIVFGDHDVLRLEMAIETPGRFDIEPEKTIRAPNPLGWPRVTSGDAAFDEAYLVRAIHFDDLAARLGDVATCAKIRALAPFLTITGTGARVVAVFEVARDEVTVDDILTRFAAVLDLVDALGGPQA